MSVCDGNLCQNGGTCSTSQLNTQVRVTRNIENFSFYQSNIGLKPLKIYECSCVDGFTGEFCQFKTEQDHLLVFDWSNPLVFNGNGKMIDENAVNKVGLDVYESCSTMLNGEAVIFAAESRYTKRQVLLKYICIG